MAQPFCSLTNRVNRKKLVPIVLVTFLTLASLLIYSIVSVVGVTTVFSDGFESGSFTEWTGTRSYSYGANLTIQPTTQCEDAYAAQVVIAGIAGEYGSCLYKNLAQPYTILNARVYVRFSEDIPVNTYLLLFGYTSDGWLSNAVASRVGVYNDNGQTRWLIEYYDNSWQNALVGSVAANNWYCVETKTVVGNGNGEVHLYINGAEMADLTGLHNIGRPVQFFSLGTVAMGPVNLNVYFDAVELSPQYIGTINNPPPTPTPTPTPMITPTPSPTLSPTITATPTLTPSSVPTVIPTAEPSATLAPAIPTPTPAPIPTPMPTPTPTATPTPTINPTPKPTSTATPKVTLTPTATAEPSPSPTPAGNPIYREKNLNLPLQTVWIANDGTIYSGIDNIIYKSTNQGSTWQQVFGFNTTAKVQCIYVNSQNIVFASPLSNSTIGQEGLWRSTNGGENWSKVLTLPLCCGVISMAEDSKGYLYAGVYTTGPHADAAIFKSTDRGVTWVTVRYDASARHIHDVAVDLANDYVYAAVGDFRVNASWTAYTLRSTNGGASWQQILVLPQMMTILPVDTVDRSGRLVPYARLLATDYDNGLILRTTDDQNFSTSFDTGSQAYGFWMRRNSLNGYCYASFIGGEGPSRWIAGIWVSTDLGVTWSQYKGFTVSTPYSGSPAASNFHNGTLIYTVKLDDGYHNSVIMYPEYSSSNMISERGVLDLTLLQWIMLSSVSTAALTRLIHRKVTIANRLKLKYRERQH